MKTKIMKIFVYLSIIALISISYAESCQLIKFNHKNGKADFYEKLNGKSCNGEPIYKMLDDVFFMYKLSNSEFWCEIYTPSKLVVCHAECDELRFDMKDLYSPQGSIPLEYNGHFNEWIPNKQESISCNDHNDFNDVFTHNSVQTPLIEKLQEQLEIIQEAKNENQTTTPEIKLDNLMKNIKEIQSNSFNINKQNSDEDKYTVSMVSDFENKKLSSNVTRPLLQTASRFIQTNNKNINIPTTDNREIFKSKISSKVNKFVTIDKSKSSLKRVDILNNRDNSCTQIELEINEKDFNEGSLIFNILPNQNCLNYPIYQSEQMFLFRNVFGEWCQKELDNFKTSVECYRKCKSILLGPGKIKSPIETSLVTVFVKNTDMIYATIKNHRYKCKAFKNCDQTSCLNGGKCIESGRNVKCSCPYYSTGSFCEQIIDTCYSNPCLNGGECSAKPFKNPVCTCTPDFHGKFCEKEVVHCKFNPCKNGGKCKTQINKQVECLCPKEFKGTFCDVPAFDLCKNRLIGENIPHPEDNKLFLVCLHDGQYKISPCPIGLVFNQYKGRCDYDNKEQILKQHPCESNINNCKNNAKCIPIDDNDKYICECQSGFNGTFCENNVINDCDNQCGLNGQCIDLVNDYICMCENGLYGKDCHTNMVKIPCVGKTENTTRHSYPFDQSIIIECDHNGRLSVKKCPSNLVWDSHRAICTYPPERPNIGLLGIKCLKKDCQNNGKCIIDEDNNARCQCQKGFEGDLCEINIDECASNPCMNNGKCVDGINSYYCVCENKFLDKDCCCLDAINPCHNVLNEFHLKKDRTVRYTHPFSNEKFIVCNLEGFAQVLDCPEGLVWKEDEQTCALKNDNINEIYTGICTNGRKDLVLPYPYSGLKYAVCLEEGYKLQECEKKNPYFCEKNSKCVKDFKKECKNVRF